MTNHPSRSERSSDDETLLSVILEPLPDKTDEDVTRWLADANAKGVQILAPRFISAAVPAECLDEARRFASVTVKTRKQLRGPS
jgi:hypothetical protein